jgi:putative ABC transport system permease protein
MHHPPKIFLRFFRWFCHPDLRDHIEGDLMELYGERRSLYGKRRADLKFIIDVILLFRPSIIRPVNNYYENSNNIDMLSNYLKVGIRNILKYKIYSSINIGGLALGIAASMLIILYIGDELSYDRFLKDSDRIYRIGSSGSFEGSAFESAVSSPPIAAAILQEIPEVEEATRFGWWRAQPMRYGDKAFIEKQLLAADSNFFQFFSFSLISGDPKTVLHGTNKIVITETTARRYFGSENALGKILLRGEARIATEITGIVKDPPANSHIRFDMILSSPSWNIMQVGGWSNTFLYTYIKTNLPEVVKKKFDVITEKNLGPDLERVMGVSLEEFKSHGNRFGFFLQPMLDIHLKSELSSELTPTGNIQYIYVFGAVAFFVLLMACINFINLSTARAATRAKEVGVRKSIGALREKLIGQFLSESMLFSFSATFIALAIVGLVLSSFNSLAGKDIPFQLLTTPTVIIYITLFALLIGVLAGIYPAFYLTKFRPIDVLKGKVGVGARKSTFRNSLVTFQFVISMLLIVGSLVISRQLEYMQHKNLGFDKENVISLAHGWSLGNRSEEFKTELLMYPQFNNASLASALPPNITDSNLFRKGGSEQDIDLHVMTADYDHLSTMGYVMADGRFFSPEFPSDSSAIVLNEAAYKALAYKQVVGNTIINFNAAQPVSFNLIGVVKDFNFENLKNAVKPMAIILNAGKNQWMVRQSNNEVAIRIAPGDPSKAIQKLAIIWKKYSSSPFEFTFLDQNIDATFRSEVRLGKIVFMFTVLTIVIACLGLFGLATYLGEQRSKEISIRKVLGASIPEVITLLLKDFVLLIAIAFIIAAPLGWLIMKGWLNGFAYRTIIEWWIIVLSGVLAFLIAIITIGYQSLKVARQNPVDSLKSE